VEGDYVDVEGGGIDCEINDFPPFPLPPPPSASSPHLPGEGLAAAYIHSIYAFYKGT